MEKIAPSDSAEMYLKTIHALSEDGGLVPISQLAERLGFSVVSVSEMVHRLVDQGLVAHTPYRGVALTSAGARLALGIVRRHRLWELFLSERLGLPWAQVHEAACNLEHAAGAEVAEALARYLDQPETCPHGNPIPSPEGKLSQAAGRPLKSMQIGEQSRVRHIQPENAEVLDRLEKLGIKPGVMVRITDFDRLDSFWTIEVAGQSLKVGNELAAHIVMHL